MDIWIYVYGADVFFLWGGKVKFVMEKQVLPRIYLLNCLVTEIKYIVVVIAGRQESSSIASTFSMRLFLHKQRQIKIDSIMIDFKCIYNFSKWFTEYDTWMCVCMFYMG